MSELGLDLHERLVRLARAQLVAVAADDLAAFDSLALEREALMPRLGVPRTHAAVHRANGLLSLVRRLDQASQAQLQARLADGHAELARMRAGRQAVRAYGHTPRPRAAGSTA
jgi:hypothetical protein